MICWKCLRKMDPWLDDNNRQILRCRCGNKPGPGNDQARADRLMELVAAIESGMQSNPALDTISVGEAIGRASHVLAEIERRVLDGTLWEGEKP